MRLKNARHFKKIGLLMAAMLIDMGVDAQVKNFEYSYGCGTNSVNAAAVKVLNDKSILSANTWTKTDWGSVMGRSSNIIVHKLSADGKLIWKTILNAENAYSTPLELDVLGDGSIICFSDAVIGCDGFAQLIKLDSNGSLMKHIEFTHASDGYTGFSMVAYKDFVYTTSNTISNYPNRQTLIQKFDKNLNQLASVTITGFYSKDAVKFQDNLLVVGERDTAYSGPALMILDDNLNIKSATQFVIGDSVSWHSASTITVDFSNPIITGSYTSTDTRLNKNYFIYIDSLHNSRCIYGNKSANLAIANNSLYVIGENSGDAFIANYDTKTGMENWTNVYGGDEQDEFNNVRVVDNAVYCSGNTLSYKSSKSWFYDIYLVKADINGRNTCAKARSIPEMQFEDANIVKYDFSYTIAKIDIPYNINLKAVSTTNYYDTLACGSSSTSNIQHLSGTADIEVYPTVTSGIVNLNHIDVQKVSSYQLVNVNGQVMMNGKLKNVNNSIDVSNLSDGFYMLRVLDEKTKAYSTFKIVKQSN
jgi:hypothetical protein